MARTRSRSGLLLATVATLGVLVTLLVSISSASPIPEATLSRASNDTFLEDDYYSAEDEYEYQDNAPLPAKNVTLDPIERHGHALPTSSSSTTTTTTRASEVETNLLEEEEAPEPSPQVCPLECQCSHGGAVDCSGLGLNRLPSDLPKEVVTLDLSRNRLTEIDLNDLEQFNELRELNLSQNAIQHVHPLVGEGKKLPQLFSIDLAENLLTGVLDPDLFKGVSGLKRLSLSNNSLGLPEESFLNLPYLEELYLRNCSLDGLTVDMFSNLGGLKVLDLADNPPYSTDIDSNTFEPLTSIKKLHLGVMGEEQVLELCTMLTTIDVIHFPDYKISCFEYVNGYTFEQSIISNTPPPEVDDPYVPPVAPADDTGLSEEVAVTVSGQSEKQEEEEAKENEAQVEEAQRRALVTTTSSTTTTVSPVTDAEDGAQNKKSGVNQDLMNQILLVIILLAFVGLVIGVICRKDYFGIKTKCCRTRRPSQTDQVTPAPEEVPLNKISTVLPVANGNGNGTPLTAATQVED